MDEFNIAFLLVSREPEVQKNIRESVTNGLGYDTIRAYKCFENCHVLRHHLFEMDLKTNNYDESNLRIETFKEPYKKQYTPGILAEGVASA